MVLLGFFTFPNYPIQLEAGCELIFPIGEGMANGI